MSRDSDLAKTEQLLTWQIESKTILLLHDEIRGKLMNYALLVAINIEM